MELFGKVVGEDAHDVAVRLAGALAEAGVQEIEIIPRNAPRNTQQDGPVRIVHARGTDLPGEIASALAAASGAVTLRVVDRDTTIEVVGGEASWRSGDMEIADRLLAARG